MEQITASTAIAFCIGMFISGIVSFLVCSCIVAEQRYDAQKVWADGYTAGYTDAFCGIGEAVEEATPEEDENETD